MMCHLSKIRPLLACPHCKSTDVKRNSQGAGQTDPRGMVFYVECKNCGAQGPLTASPCCAANAWNRRSEATRLHIPGTCLSKFGPVQHAPATVDDGEIPW